MSQESEMQNCHWKRNIENSKGSDMEYGIICCRNMLRKVDIQRLNILKCGSGEG